MAQLVKIEVVAERLSMTVATVKKLARDRQIPFVRFSRKLWRFNLQEVDAAIAKLKIRPR